MDRLLPPFTPKIPSPFERYLDPDGPTHLSYRDEQTLEQAARRATIRVNKPRDAYQYIEREQLRAEIEARLPDFDVRRQMEDDLAWYIRYRVAVAAPPERHAELVELAEKMESCRREAVVGRKPAPLSGLVFAWENKCDQSRVCPDGSREDAMRVSQHYTPAIEEWLASKPTHRAYYCVFTGHNYAPGRLAAGHKHLYERFNEWKDHKLLYTPVQFINGKVKHGRPRNLVSWPQIKGALTVMEDPLSADLEWNVHINVVLLVDGEFTYKDAREIWGGNVHFEEIDRGRVAEVMPELIKYSAKQVPTEADPDAGAIDPRTGRARAPAMTEWPPELWLEWWDAQKYRRVRAYGALYAVDGKRWDAHDPFSVDDAALARELGQRRLAWLERAGIEGLDYLLTPWSDIPGELKPQLREAIARSDDSFDMELVEWIGQLSWSWAGYALRMNGDDQVPPRARRSVDLIQGDKSGASAAGGGGKLPGTGPPPI